MKKDQTELDEEISRILHDMQDYDRNSEEYATMLGHLERLHELKTKDRPQKVSRETWATIGGNLAGILIVVGYERMNVITSKAFSLIGKRS